MRFSVQCICAPREFFIYVINGAATICSRKHDDGSQGEEEEKIQLSSYYLESRYLLGSRGRTGITRELTEAKDRGKSDVIKHARKSAEQSQAHIAQQLLDIALRE